MITLRRLAIASALAVTATAAPAMPVGAATTSVSGTAVFDHTVHDVSRRTHRRATARSPATTRSSCPAISRVAGTPRSSGPGTSGRPAGSTSRSGVRCSRGRSSAVRWERSRPCTRSSPNGILMPPRAPRSGATVSTRSSPAPAAAGLRGISGYLGFIDIVTDGSYTYRRSRPPSLTTTSRRRAHSAADPQRFSRVLRHVRGLLDLGADVVLGWQPGEAVLDDVRGDAGGDRLRGGHDRRLRRVHQAARRGGRR